MGFEVLYNVLITCIINYPAKMAPKSEISHSGELNPMIPTPWYGSKPSCYNKESERFIYSLNK